MAAEVAVGVVVDSVVAAWPHPAVYLPLAELLLESALLVGKLGEHLQEPLSHQDWQLAGQSLGLPQLHQERW